MLPAFFRLYTPHMDVLIQKFQIGDIIRCFYRGFEI